MYFIETLYPHQQPVNKRNKPTRQGCSDDLRIPAGERPAIRQAQALATCVPGLTLLVHKHKGCTRGAQGVHTGLSRQQCRAPKRVARQGVADRFWAFKGRISHLCENPALTGGQKDTLVGRIQAFVSCAITASCATHIGPPPYSRHAPSFPPPYILYAPTIPKLCQFGVSARQTGRLARAWRE